MKAKYYRATDLESPEDHVVTGYTTEKVRSASALFLEEDVDVELFEENRRSSNSLKLERHENEKIQEHKIYELTGVVLENNDSGIKIRFKEGVEIEFPRALFENIQEFQFGTPVNYQICERSNGVRYQKFIVSTDNAPNEYSGQIDDVLKKIDSHLE